MSRRKPTAVWWEWLALGLLVTLSLATCRSATPQTPRPPGGPTPTVTVPFELPVILSLTGAFDDQTLALLDKQIATFELANPDVRVEIVRAPPAASERRERFAAQLGEGDRTQDIYLLNPTWLAEFAANGWLLPLGGYVQSEGIELGGFFPASVQANALGGQLMALPWTVDGGLLYYRRDLLAQHGYEPPTTWADLQHTALDLRASAGLPYGFVWQGAAYEGLTCNTLEQVWAQGGEVWNPAGKIAFDSAETRAALQQMADLLTSGVSPGEVAAYREAASLHAFQQGDALFLRNWAYAWDRLNGGDSAVAGLVGLAPLPASCLGGTSLALSAHSQHPAQAFRFMAFLVGYEQQAQLALHGVQPPALEAVYGDEELLQADPSLQALHAALSAARPRPQVASYSEFSEAIYSEVNKMLRGKQDVEVTATRVQYRLEAIVERR